MIADLLVMTATLASSPALGLAEGQCRPAEPGPAFEITVTGLKDRIGQLKAELYPANDADFLADDNRLVAAGKSFARVVINIAPQGPVSLCIRAPRAGRYALALLHDRDGDHRFSLNSDGIGFPGNPRLGWSRPAADTASAMAGAGITPLVIRMNYRRGLAMRPLEDK